MILRKPTDRLLLALVCSCLLMTVCHAGVFSNPPLIPTSYDPAGLAVGDADRDGNLDLFYVDGQASYTLHVLLGRGDGTFAHAQDVPLPAGICGYPPCHITVADINGDGQVDLLIGGRNSATGQIAALLGNGDGTFQSPQVSVLPPNPSIWPILTGTVAVGDFNGDGMADIAVPDLANGYVYVAYGDDQGHFSYASSLFANSPGIVYAVDLNGDGKLDLVANDRLGGQAYVFLGNGDGTFQAAVRYSTGGDIRLADMDGDGHPDLLVRVYPGQIEVLKGNADGTFGTASVVANLQDPSVWLVGAADYNGDQIADIVVTNSTGIGVLLGQGNLSYQGMISSLAPATSRDQWAAGDFNKDGKTDVALGVDGGILVLNGQGDGAFATVTSYDMGHQVGAVAVADFTGDNIPDIAVTLPAAQPRLLVGTGNGAFTVGPDPNASYNSGNAPGAARVADFNGDGKKDLVIGEPPTAPTIAANNVLFGHGDGTFSAPLQVSSGALIVADANKDGRSDFVTVSGTTLAADLGQTGNTFIETDTGLRIGETLAAVDDINNDGKPDVLLSSVGEMEVWFGAGDGTFSFGSSIDTTGLPIIGGYGTSVIADLDGDGNPDLILSPPPAYSSYMLSSPSLVIFYGHGDGSFDQPALIPVSHWYSNLVVADLDQDLKPDLVLNDGAGIAVIFNLGARAFSPESHYVAGISTAGLAVADVNGDGFPDLVVPNSAGTQVAVLLNLPNGVAPAGLAAAGTLTVVPEPSANDQPFTATLQVNAPNSTSPAPTGTVSFSLDGQFVSTVALAQGQASQTFAAGLPGGLHIIKATYNGDATYAPATYAWDHMVNPPVYTTQTTLTASPSTLYTSQTVRLIASVTTAGSRLTGIVTFYDGSASLGAQMLDQSGTAQLDTALLGAGSHSITAKYQGATVYYASDIWETYSSSTSAPVTVTVQSVPTTTALSASSTSATAATVLTFTATVTADSGVPFGGVTFFDGATAIGTTSLLSDGHTSFSTALLAVGTHSITAKFNANATFAASTSPATSVSIQAASSTQAATLTSVREAPGEAGESELIAQVTSNGLTPAGTITFLSDGEVLGTATVSASGSAVLPSSAVGTGAHKVYASFHGNTLLAPSVSPALDVDWPTLRPDFLVTAAALQPGVAEVTLTGNTPGFKASVAFSCGDGVPNGYGCTFTPSSLNGSGVSRLSLRRVRANAGTARHRPWTALGFALMGVAFCAASGRRRRARNFVLMVALSTAAFTAGCGLQDAAPRQESAVITVRATSHAGTTSETHSTQVVLTLPR